MRGVWVRQGAVDVRELPEPALEGAGDVKLRVLEVGVCGTDRELVKDGFSPPPGADGLVLGHEALAEVLACGPAVAAVKRGDLVVPMVRVPCPHARCGPCRAGRQDFCVTGDYTERGIKQAHGFMAERVVVPEAHVVRVPAALRGVAVLVEPLTIAEKALDQLRAVQERLPAPGWSASSEAAAAGAGSAGVPAQAALVLGAGPVGLLGAMALVARGYRTAVFSRQPPGGPRAALVESFGAEHLSGEEVPLAGARGRVGPYDVVYEATGAAQAAFDALPLLAPNGIFVLTGVPGRHGPIEIRAARAVRELVLGNQVLLGTVNAGRRHFNAAVRDLALFSASWPEALAALVTGRFPLERAADAIAPRAGAVKQLVEIEPGARGAPR
jgi:threonine dehydrogenase-like Zn-dependent dehydrogenase